MPYSTFIELRFNINEKTTHEELSKFIDELASARDLIESFKKVNVPALMQNDCLIRWRVEHSDVYDMKPQIVDRYGLARKKDPAIKVLQDNIKCDRATAQEIIESGSYTAPSPEHARRLRVALCAFVSLC
jgi:hypothetical protein